MSLNPPSRKCQVSLTIIGRPNTVGSHDGTARCPEVAGDSFFFKYVWTQKYVISLNAPSRKCQVH